MKKIIASLKNARKVCPSVDTEIIALDYTTVDIKTGELTMILGPSGSGKTTLLSLLGCIIYPSEGEVIINGQNVTQLSEKELAKIRPNEIGFVFQQFNLLNPLTALENVMQSLLLKGYKKAEALKKAEIALSKVQMTERKNNLPKKLSGGQKQRVAIARALVTDPEIILCDEPTASLDTKSAKVVIDELKSLARTGKAIILVTHDLRLKTFADTLIYVEEGKISTEPNEMELSK